MTRDASKLLDYLTSKTAEMTAYLKDLVLAESPSLCPETQDRVFRLIEEPLQQIGYETERIPGSHSGGHAHQGALHGP